MGFDEEMLFSIKTSLNVEVRTTVKYWEYLITIKHPIMKGKEDLVKDILQFPDEIRQSKTDRDVFLYYKQFDKLYCVVVRHLGMAGFLITSYPTDKVKEGNVIWTK
ncbi:MAG: DUF4258 domain-containing protein [Nitrospirota bacterium]